MVVGAAGGGEWLLKYITHVMVEPQRFAEHFCFSLRTYAYSAVNIELIPPPLVPSITLPPQPVRAAVWQPALWIRVRFELQINVDITAKIWLYFNLHRIIKIEMHTNRYLRSSAVNNEIVIIPACFLSTHVLSWIWEWCVQTATVGVVECCRQRPWLLKYIIYKILHCKARKVTVTISLW